MKSWKSGKENREEKRRERKSGKETLPVFYCHWALMSWLHRGRRCPKVAPPRLVLNLSGLHLERGADRDSQTLGPALGLEEASGALPPKWGPCSPSPSPLLPTVFPQDLRVGASPAEGGAGEQEFQGVWGSRAP